MGRAYLRRRKMSDQAKVSEALGVAVEMEKKGVAFYQAAAQKMDDPFAKKMFLSIAMLSSLRSKG